MISDFDLTSDFNYDSLAEFHLHCPQGKSWEILAKVVNILKKINYSNRAYGFKLLKEILDEATSHSILKLLCNKRSVNFDTFEASHGHQNKLLLHFLCFITYFNSVPEVAHELDISADEAGQILEQLKGVFIIEDFLHWLESLLESYQCEKKLEIKEKAMHLHGREVVGQARDTGEERRTRQRRNMD